jgi:hypothetical protein
MFHSEEGLTAAIIVIGTVIITSLLAWAITFINKIDSDTGKEGLWDDPTTKDYK